MIDLLLLEFFRSPFVEDSQSNKGYQTDEFLHSEELHWSNLAFRPNQGLWGWHVCSGRTYCKRQKLHEISEPVLNVMIKIDGTVFWGML